MELHWYVFRRIFLGRHDGSQESQLFLG